MPVGGGMNEEIEGTILRLEEQLDVALQRALELHRTGSEEAALAETAVAVGAAKALEVLTGESCEAQLERRENKADAAPSPSDDPRPWFRRQKLPPK